MSEFWFWFELFMLIIVFYEGVRFFKSKTKIGGDEDIAISVIFSALFSWVLYTYMRSLLYLLFFLIIGKEFINKIYEEVSK